MASINQFISVLRGANAGKSGNLIVKVRPTIMNIQTPVTITITVPITDSMTEVDIAEALTTAMNAEFLAQDCLYTPDNLSFSTNPPTATYRAVQVDHIVDVWSQVAFRVTADVSGVQGLQAYAGAGPIFATIHDFDCMAPALGATIDSFFTIPADDKDKIALLLSGSQLILAMAQGFFIIGAQYLHIERGFSVDGFNLEWYPILFYDTPKLRDPQIFPNDNLYMTTIFDYMEVDHSTGSVTFPALKDAGTGSVNGRRYPLGRRPLAMSNVLKMTYCAGLSSVSPILAQESIKQALAFSQLPLGMSSLKIGTASATFDRKALNEATLAAIKGLF